MLTLGIETSCDETSCAILKDRDELLSNVISSSLFRHKPFGGVVPEIASRHSLEQIDVVYQEAMKEANVKSEDLDLVAVTQGPGLIGSLFVGVCFAKTLAYQLDIPLVGVNHLEAHLVANFIGCEEPDNFIGLLVSGGHTSLSFHEGGKVKLLGATVDDAVGEAYDKVSKLIGLGYPGGPIIEKRAREGKPGTFKFTKPKQKNPFDFSFSGIKTAVLHEVQRARFGDTPEGKPGSRIRPAEMERQSGAALSEEFICDLSRGFQDSVVSWLVEKTLKAADEYGSKAIVVGGGVSANQFLKNALEVAGKEQGVRVLFPERKLSLDNAGMIARRGLEAFENGERASIYLTGVPSLKMIT